MLPALEGSGSEFNLPRRATYVISNIDDDGSVIFEDLTLLDLCFETEGKTS